MTPDPNRKSLRQFQCRDYLWETFEQMSAELDCSVDYLLNEALRQYARSRDRGGPLADIPEQPDSRSQAQAYRGPGMPGQQGGMPGRAPGSGMPPMRPAGAPTMGMGMPPLGGPGVGGAPMAQPPGAPMPGIGVMPPFGGGQGAPAMGGQRQGLPPLQGGPGGPNRLPSLSGGGQAPGMAPPGMAPPGMAPPMARQGAPGLPPMIAPGGQRPGGPMGPGPAGLPPRLPSQQGMGGPQMPQPRPMMPGPAPRGNTLIATFEGQSYPVTKEEFVIGRGQKTSDLTIRDSNVSRRHACVVLYNGQYWIVDQQSTNGVEFNGAKVDRKVIEDGDLFKICDHEIRFAYR